MAADYENFDTVTAALDAVVRGLSEKEQARVDAMAKAIEDAIAGLKKKQDTETLEYVISEGVSASALTDEVKKKTGCNTVEELTKYMLETVVKESYAGASSVVLDVTIMVRINGGTPVEATKDNIPAEGVDIILPYPQGTNKDDYDFTVSHLITRDWNGQTPGTVEYPAVTKLDGGLKVHVLSASPFAIAWKSNEKDPENKPGNSGNDDGNKEEVTAPAPAENTVGTNVTTQAVKTGDDMNVAAILWSLLLLVAVVGAGVLVYFHRRRADNSKSE